MNKDLSEHFTKGLSLYIYINMYSTLLSSKKWRIKLQWVTTTYPTSYIIKMHTVNYKHGMNTEPRAIYSLPCGYVIVYILHHTHTHNEPVFPHMAYIQYQSMLIGTKRYALESSITISVQLL